jgi:hypothetical protein
MEELKNLQAAILEIATSYWQGRNWPVLLSNMPPLLEAKVPGYKDIIAPRNLKTFIKETADAAGYRLVEHPSQRARLGVIPSGINFEFPSDEEGESHIPAPRKNEEIVLSFLRALSTLPNSELEKVVIPASVLARLLK